jgi:hypothetical protein
MRMAFGLVSVLVTIGIIVLVMSMMLDKQTGSIPIALNAREEAKQIAGVGQDGEAALHSANLEEGHVGGKFGKLTVTAIQPGGAYDTYFGLQPGDEIVEIGQSGSLMRVGDISNGDAGLARALLSDAYARQQQIVVIRNGQRLTLPAAPGTVVIAAQVPTTAPAPAAPANAAPAPAEKSGNPLSRQLDALKNAGGGGAN